MEHYLVKGEMLVRGLKNRNESIKQVAENMRKKDLTVDTDYSDLYVEVAYFVHQILDQQELQAMFLELLNYSEAIKKDKDYEKMADEINTNMQSLVGLLASDPNITKLPGQYANPNLYPIMLSAATY